MNKQYVSLLILTAAITTALYIPQSRVEYHVYAKEKAPEELQLTREQNAWFGALEWCESRGKADAVNPKDTDNTPSYGVLQFKPGTFSDFAKKYEITTTDYKNPDAQEQIVKYWITHPGEVNWYQQFPGCVKKLGTPPKLSTSTIDKK